MNPEALLYYHEMWGEGMKAESKWLREGIEQALKHLQANRKSLAIDALKATLSRQTW